MGFNGRSSGTASEHQGGVMEFLRVTARPFLGCGFTGDCTTAAVSIKDHLLAMDAWIACIAL